MTKTVAPLPSPSSKLMMLKHRFTVLISRQPDLDVFHGSEPEDEYVTDDAVDYAECMARPITISKAVLRTVSNPKNEHIARSVKVTKVGPRTVKLTELVLLPDRPPVLPIIKITSPTPPESWSKDSDNFWDPQFGYPSFSDYINICGGPRTIRRDSTSSGKGQCAPCNVRSKDCVGSPNRPIF
ncbi:hypothetical protein K491DRAFT_67507 [Lophiostoma macrostomum CBS 122681]|uniref:Uncharacterized protein n=1 Tax=Lophiostoma macrostomum CBS 122681 TaxID=1314788 RepID=A0A6A6T0K3_9PLEO|nr:hypothetical protein K491DRAFT_67507 [Lophiostoma macrostomum CBS 122681]